MALSNRTIEILLKVNDKATKSVRRLQKSFVKLRKVAKRSLKGISKTFGFLLGKIKTVAKAIAFATTAAAVGFIALAKSIVSTGAQFETYNATLKVIMGSQEKATKAMGWLREMAKKTPYTIDKLTEAFVKLTAYGIEPTKVMTTLGDTASAMGKDIELAVLALANAQTGEFETLKTFGIKAVELTNRNAKAMGATLEDVGRTALAFTDSMGKEQIKIIDRTNRALITSTIMSIWNEKYEGAMKERVATFVGLTSNIEDAWIQFKGAVGKSLLPHINKWLDVLLKKLDAWAEDGTLKGWGDMIAAVLHNTIAWLAGFVASFKEAFEKIGMNFFGFQSDIVDSEEAGRKFGVRMQEIFTEVRKVITEWWVVGVKPIWDKFVTAMKDEKFWAEVKLNLEKVGNAFITLANAIKTVHGWWQKVASLKGSVTLEDRMGKEYAERVQDKNAKLAQDTNDKRTHAQRNEKASGGGVYGNKPILVGERGPEIFTPSTAGRVTANDQIGGGQTVNIFTNATAHGINNALGSRMDVAKRGQRIGLRVSHGLGQGQFSNASGLRTRGAW
jgi:hypothetical protein